MLYGDMKALFKYLTVVLFSMLLFVVGCGAVVGGSSGGGTGDSTNGEVTKKAPTVNETTILPGTKIITLTFSASVKAAENIALKDVITVTSGNDKASASDNPVVSIAFNNSTLTTADSGDTLLIVVERALALNGYVKIKVPKTALTDVTGVYSPTEDIDQVHTVKVYDISSNTVSYGEATSIYGSAKTFRPRVNTIPPLALASYSIALSDGSSVADTHITISGFTIQVADSTPAGSYALKIRATANNTGYTGTKTIDITITVAPKSIATGYTFAYDTQASIANQGKRGIVPAETTKLPTTGIEYTIKAGTEVAGISIADENSPAINVASTVVAGAHTLTIVATGTGNYADSLETQVTIEVISVASNSLQYPTNAQTTVVYSTAKTIEPRASTMPTGTTYAITTGAVASISIDHNANIKVADTTAVGDYPLTITATYLESGTSKTATASITIKVMQKAMSEYSLSYTIPPITYGTEASAIAPTTDSKMPAVSYGIVKKADSTVDKHVGITIDESTGKLLLSNAVSAATYQLTVTASPTDTANYSGTKTADITIVVGKRSIATGYIFAYAHYENIPAGTGRSGLAPVPDTNLPITGISYAISGDSSKVDGISLVSGTSAEVAVASTVAAGDYTLTIVATGTGNYSGNLSATLQITVKSIPEGIFTYSSIADIEYSSARIIEPENTMPAETTYSLAAKASSSAVPNTITINSTSTDSILDGAIVVGSRTPVGEYALTVTATPSSGTAKTADVTIKITQKDMSEYSLSYAPLASMVYRNFNTITPTIDSNMPELNYSISTTLIGGTTTSGITVSTEGVVSLDNTVTVGNYMATVTASPTDSKNYSGNIQKDIIIMVNAKAVALSYATIPSITYGTAGTTISPTLEDPMPNEVSYSLVAQAGNTKPEGISISNDGVIAVANTVDAGSYSLNATATPTDKNYTDGSTSILIIISPKQMSEFSLSYDSIPTTTYGTTSSSIEPTADSAMPDINYVIDTKAGASVAKHEGIGIHLSDGTITVAKTVPANTYELTVTATPINTTTKPKNTSNYWGARAIDITITVNKKSIDDYSALSYTIPSDITYGTGTGATPIAPTKDSTMPAVSYTIAQNTGSSVAKHDGIDITASGDITVSAAVDATTYELTVTATPIDTANYFGSKTADISITVTPKSIATGYTFAYVEQTVVAKAGQSGIAPIETTSLPTTSIEYTIKAGTEVNGISIPDNTSPKVYVAPDTVAIQKYTLTIVAKGMGNYTDTKEASIIINVVAVLPNTLTYANRIGTNSLVYGAAETTIAPEVNSMAPGTTYAITDGIESGISLESTGGASANIVVANTTNADTYVLTITATYDDSGESKTKTASITITVSPKQMSDYSSKLSYTDASTTYGTAIDNIAITNTTQGMPTVLYGLAAQEGSDSPAGITIVDSSNGTISVSNTVDAKIYKLTVSATTSNANYTGAATANITITVNPKNMSIFSSNLKYESIPNTITFGTGATGIAITKTAPAEGTMPSLIYNIAMKDGSTKHEGIRIDSSGNISISNTVDATTYGLTVSATTGNTNYTEAATTDVAITVNPQPMGDFSGNLSYTDASTTFGTAINDIAITNNAVGSMPTVSYSIAKKVGSTVDKHSGITIVPASGTISVGNNVDAATYVLTISAGTVNTNYTGVATTDITIAVNQKALSDYSLSYTIPTITYTTGTETPIQPTTDSAMPAVNYDLAMADGSTKPAGIDIVSTSGGITVGNTVPAGTYTLSVTASPANTTEKPRNTNNYSGTKTVAIAIVVDKKSMADFSAGLSYGTIPTVNTGKGKNDITITTPSAMPAVSYDLAMADGSTKPIGISINASGTIAVASGTAKNTYNLTVTARPTDTANYKDVATIAIAIVVEDYSAPPNGLVLTAIEANITLDTIPLTWSITDAGKKPDNSAATIEKYEVYYKKGVSVSASDGTAVSLASPTDTSVEVTSLTDNTEYAFIVVATNNAGKSSTTMVVTAKTLCFIATNTSLKPYINSMTDKSDLTCIKTSAVTDMSGLFQNDATFNGDVSTWDTSNVANMSNMFSGAAVFNKSIGGWNTEKVTNMSNMFNGATAFNQDISGWTTTAVANMSNMFSGATVFNQDISGWSTASVTSMNGIFNNAEAFSQDLESWAVTSVSSITADIFDNSKVVEDKKLPTWFNVCPYPLDRAKLVTCVNSEISAKGNSVDLNHINTYRVTDMNSLFSSMDQFNGDISGWDTSNVADMSEMFHGANEFNQDIGAWDTSNVTSLRYTFNGAQKFNQDLSKWNTEKVTTLFATFSTAVAFDGDVSTWNTSEVTDMNSTFSDANSFNQDISKWSTAKVEVMVWMFYNAKVFNQDIGGWNTAKVEDMSVMFLGATVFDQDLDSWNTSSHTRKGNMFKNSGMESNPPCWYDDDRSDCPSP